MKIKYIALCLLLVLVSCQRDEEMEISQVSIGKEHLEASYSSVEISCSFQANVTIKNVQAYLSTEADFSSAKSYSLTEKSKNTFGATIEGLKDASTYYVRYKISNRWSSKMIDEVSEFKTIPYTIPTVQTSEVTDVTHNTAIVGGVIIENGGQEITERGVVYGKSPNPTIENSIKVENKDKAEAFTCLLTNLEVVTTYYACAYAINEKGIAYGEEISLTTLSTSATMGDISAIEIGGTTATIQAELLADGGANISQLGICYNLKGEPTTNDSVVLSSTNAVGVYQCTLNNLYSVTTYYVRAFATNANGTVYSDQISFRTETAIATVISSQATNVSYTSATVGGNVTDDGGASVTERGICYSTSANPTTANTKITSGSGLGEFTCNLTDLQDGTIYYARAYAINEKGIAYGEEVCFTTKTKTIAAVVTTPATNVSYTSATVGGNVTDDGGAGVTERGICYSTSANPTTANTKITSGSGTGSFVCNLTELQDATTYYARAYAINEKGIAYGEEVCFTTKTKTIAAVVTTPATNVSYTSATVGGNVTDDGGATVTERGICYSTSANPTTANTKITSGSGTGSFVCNLTELQDATTYYARAYAINEKGIAYGEEVCFTTKTKTIAAVVTTPATNVSYTSATVGGNVTNDGGASITERGVVYATTQNPTTADSKVSNGSGLGEFTCNLTDLQDGVTYYARAYAINAKGTAYGEEVSFTTKKQFVPTIVTTQPTNIAYNSATVGGNVTNDGGAEVTERGIVYATTQNPTTADSKVSNGSGLGEFTCNLTDLQDGVTYYARAYAINAKGTAYGKEVSFTTKTKTIATVATTPATNVSYTSATVGGNVTDDGGASVTERGICYSTSANPTIANSKVASGSGTGAFSCNLTDLQDNTTYYVCAYAVNAKGTAYGEEVSFTTIKIGDPLTFTVNGVSFTMIAVEGGTFTMGATSEQGNDADSDEKPTHKVTLSDYMIGETEVTQELWKAVMGSNPSYFSGTQNPVERVSWEDCQNFIAELNAMTGKQFRLPTEAEWEFAARGGNKSNGFKYSGSGSIDKVAWYDGNSSSKTHPVKQKQANELGIYDMSGNVWEWCQDWYGSYSSSAQTNPTGPSSGSYRVIRGGSWGSDAGNCRVSGRSTPAGTSSYLGLRLAL